MIRIDRSLWLSQYGDKFRAIVREKWGSIPSRVEESPPRRTHWLCFQTNPVSWVPEAASPRTVWPGFEPDHFHLVLRSRVDLLYRTGWHSAIAVDLDW
jgi:hypothetical protein